MSRCDEPDLQNLMSIFITCYIQGGELSAQEASLVELQVLLGQELASRIVLLREPGKAIIRVQPLRFPKVYLNRGENCKYVLGKLLPIALQNSCPRPPLSLP